MGDLPCCLACLWRAGEREESRLSDGGNQHSAEQLGCHRGRSSVRDPGVTRFYFARAPTPRFPREGEPRQPRPGWGSAAASPSRNVPLTAVGSIKGRWFPNRSNVPCTILLSGVPICTSRGKSSSDETPTVAVQDNHERQRTLIAFSPVSSDCASIPIYGCC